MAGERPWTTEMSTVTETTGQNGDGWYDFSIKYPPVEMQPGHYRLRAVHPAYHTYSTEILLRANLFDPEDSEFDIYMEALRR
jgi:hypothetical protein